MTRTIWLLAVALLGACKGSSEGGPVLPPASGSGAAPVDVPTLSEVAKPEASAAEPDAFVGTGTLKPKEEAQLGPKTTGTLTHIAVEEGDRVKKGQLLFRLDGSQARLGVEQAKAAVSVAEVGLSAAQLELQRTKALADRGSVAPAALDAAKARYDGAKAAVEQANAALDLAKRGAGDTAVRSPIAGVVTKKLKNVGEAVTMVPPTVVLVVEDLDRLELRARLPERALRELEKGGETLRVTFPALGVERTVAIERVTPTVDARTRTVEVVADIDNADHRLKPGMMAEVRLAGNGAATGRHDAPDAGPRSAAKAKRN